MDPLRDIKIKTGVLKRLTKDKLLYQKEAASQTQKIEEMKKSGEKDEYDIKKQVEVLDETLKMIPDIVKRITAAYQDLNTYMKVDDEEIKQSEVYLAAVEVMKEAKPHVELEEGFESS